MWLFGSDVGGGGRGCCEAVVESDIGGGDLVVVVGGGDRGCCDGGVVGVVGKVVVVMVVEMWLVQNNDRKRKTLPQRITALLTRRIPSEQRWGNLSEHRLTGITDLRTFMVFCKFPQP